MGKSKLLGKLTEPEPFSTAQERENNRLRLANAELKLKNAAYLREVDRLERDKELLLALDDRRNVARWSKPLKITRGQATAVIVASDWHVEEIVTRAKVNGLNEYNPKIAEASVGQLCRRSVRMIDRYRKDAKIDELVVLLLGDMISGYLHPDQVETNAMSPINACVFAEDLMERFLRCMVAESKCKRVSVITCVGNHDRTTEKMRSASRNDTSYLTLVYGHLRKRLSGVKNLEWNIGDGEFVYFDVYGKPYRGLHGDAIKYGGGVGGLTIPANKAVSNWNNTALRAAGTFFGHHHQYLANDVHGWLCNGSMMGTNCYGLRFGAAPPCQSLAIIDESRGWTDSCKIFVR